MGLLQGRGDKNWFGRATKGSGAKPPVGSKGETLVGVFASFYTSRFYLYVFLGLILGHREHIGPRYGAPVALPLSVGLIPDDLS